jgi:hypothetical protein
MGKAALKKQSGVLLQDHEVFGDGLSWGGCVFIHVLGQHSRFNGTQCQRCLAG